MTHFVVAVFVKPSNEAQVRRDVERLLAPYDENREVDGGSFADGTRWDWWVIGGRWDGEIIGADRLVLYDTCTLCKGTGTRPDWPPTCTPEWIAECNGCNGCKGTGQQARWFDPAYETLARNAARPVDIAKDFTPTAFVTPDGQWHEQARTGWFGGTFTEDEKGNQPLEDSQWAQQWGEAKGAFSDCVAVAVDCHV